MKGAVKFNCGNACLVRTHSLQKWINYYCVGKYEDISGTNDTCLWVYIYELRISFYDQSILLNFIKCNLKSN